MVKGFCRCFYTDLFKPTYNADNTITNTKFFFKFQWKVWQQAKNDKIRKVYSNLFTLLVSYLNKMYSNFVAISSTYVS